MLETADIEFVRLKELLDNYEQETKHRFDINIDGVTIKNYITSSTVVEAQNKIFAKVHKFTGPERFFVSPDNGLIIKNLKNLNINTIFELNNLLIKYQKNILKLFKSKYQDKLATSVNKAAPIIQLTDYLESINYSGRI